LIYRVSHLTEYVYRQPVSSSHHQLHLLPRAHKYQVNRWEELSIDPVPARRHDSLDYFGNRMTHVEVLEPHRRLAVLSRSEIEIFARPAPVPEMSPPWEAVRDRVRQDITIDQLAAYEFSFASPYVQISPGILEFAAKSFAPGRPIVDAAIDLMHRVHTDFVYDSAATNVSTPVDEVLAHRRGVCQDFAHLALSCLRVLGLPGRYVSGYLITAVPGQPRMIGGDASHAWLQVYCPGPRDGQRQDQSPWPSQGPGQDQSQSQSQGPWHNQADSWIDLDPTNDVVPSDKHITVAYGRDFGDVTPLQGVILGGGRHTLRVMVDVAPLPSDTDVDADIDVDVDAGRSTG
jgi:transglutaminase-like putative cysteine protease